MSRGALSSRDGDVLVVADAYKAVAAALKSAASDDSKEGISFAILNIACDDDGRRALVAADAFTAVACSQSERQPQV